MQCSVHLLNNEKRRQELGKSLFYSVVKPRNVFMQLIIQTFYGSISPGLDCMDRKLPGRGLGQRDVRSLTGICQVSELG